MSPVPKNQELKLDCAKKLEESDEDRRYRSRTSMNYLAALAIFMSGAAFAFVPVFNAFCSVSILSEVLLPFYYNP